MNLTKTYNQPELMLISPEQARLWINAENRKIRRDHVNNLARDMKNGQFTISPDIVVISNGKCMNGNHRLTAITICGIPQLMFVSFWNNIDKIQDLNVDLGAKRSFSDSFCINKRIMEPITALARIILNRPPTKAELPPFIETFEPLAAKLISTCGTSSAKTTGAQIRAAVVFIAFEKNDTEFTNCLFRSYKEFALISNNRPLSLVALYRKILKENPVNEQLFYFAYRAFSNPNISMIRAVEWNTISSLKNHVTITYNNRKKQNNYAKAS